MSNASPAVHGLLHHLEEHGFAHSPRLLGIDASGREILTFHPGHTAWELGRVFPSDEELARLGEIVRGLHEMLSDYHPSNNPNWSDRGSDPMGGGLVLHNDLGPWNLVVDGDDWVIIDWDEAAPGRPGWELALVVHSFVPLWPESALSDAEIVRRMKRFGDGYGATSQRLRAVVELIPERCHRFVEMIEHGASIGDPQLVKMLEDGHRDVWAAATEHTRARMAIWQRLLGA
jgi:Ser/Thr protein kinase RdoA (MazF antagonist)